MNSIQISTTKQGRDFREYILPVSAGIIALLGIFTNFYIPCAVALPVITVLMIIDRLGKGIVLRELTVLHAIVTCLVMPVLGYTFYTRDNVLARQWVRWMPVPQEVYFRTAVPCLAAFTMALCWPIAAEKYGDYGQKLKHILERSKLQLRENPKLAIVIMATGIVAQAIARYVPSALGFVITLVYWSAFAGVLYLYYTPNYKRRVIVLIAFALFIVGLAIQNGMFTIVAYMGITLFSFFFIGNKYSFWKKVVLFLSACALMVVLQAAKARYRALLWRGGGELDNKAQVFGSIFADQVGNFSSFFQVDAFFPFYYRTNQGYNVSLVMRTIPARKPFDNGANLAKGFASSFVPRALWPDKPEAGGKFNMMYYAGVDLRGWSTNVGPLGEAYGSFGPDGGMIYMFFLGLFIRWAYRYMFKVSQKMPLIIFWIPVVFYEVTYSAETDSMQIFNSIVKAAFFMYLLWRMKPEWLSIAKKINRRALRAKHEEASTANT
jgi:hypothetical protein